MLSRLARISHHPSGAAAYLRALATNAGKKNGLAVLVAVGLAIWPNSGGASRTGSPGEVVPSKPGAIAEGIPTAAGGSHSRVGGDTFEEALEISSLPFSDSGNTCTYVNDYDEVCPYSGSTAPDVVYRYAPLPGLNIVGLDLCSSSYDTKVYIYQAPEFSEPIACNDDGPCGYNGYQSRIDEVCFFYGWTYYIVVDGYGSSCGDYTINLVEYAPCLVDCPPMAIQENEPECVDGYLDLYNGGCDSDPPVFQTLEPQSQSCVDLCGLTCAYTSNEQLEFDEDWYEIIAEGGSANPISVEVIPDFSCVIVVLAGTCDDLTTVDNRSLTPCEPGLFEFEGLPGERFMVGIRSTDPGGGCVPGGEYWLHVCGIQDGSTADVPLPSDPPIRMASWGKIKAQYRN